MTHVWTLAALWLGLALAATVVSIWLGLATALSEIVVGTVAQLVIGAAIGADALGAHEGWITFVSGAGAIVLTFLAGAELDPEVLRSKFREAGAVGVAGFVFPFLGCFAVARFALHWALGPSWLVGVALSTTSVAVVYAVMLELGLNRTQFGKTILAACFINDLLTVLALGLIFAPFTWRTAIFAAASLAAVFGLPWVTRWFFARFGGRPSEPEAKFLLLALFGLGALAAWAGSEPVLPAYLVGMALAGVLGRDHALVRRIRTLTFGFLTPFYFVRAGAFVSVSALIAAPGAFLVLLAAKLVSKIVGVFPVTRLFANPRRESVYTTLMMSTGLTFGTISSLYGLTHHVIDQAQYSLLVATVIGSAVVPTLIANAFWLPHHLLPADQLGADDAVAGADAG